jgi:hypothetical protein
MSASELVHQAVETAIDRNPRLVVQPYEQMKAAAMILAEMLIADREPKNPLWGTITTEADMLRKTAKVVGFTE